MNLYRYKLIRALMIIITLIVFILYFLLKYKFYSLKEAEVHGDKISINSEEVKKSENSSLYNLVEVIEKETSFKIEGISIEEDFKKVILSCDKDINVIKNNIEGLKEEEVVHDIIEIDYNKNLWRIEVIFN